MTQTTQPKGRRVRIDRLLVERGFFDSRSRAQAAVLAGGVTCGGAVIAKPSELVESDAPIAAQDVHPYVSRGALKLEAALEAFGFDPKGKVCLDVGASTGGFTDLLLARGAAQVCAVDVGRDQLHPSLRANDKVRVMEGTDIRTLSSDAIAPVDLVVIDVSFISLRLVLPAALAFAAPGATLVALIKPQFEAGRAHLKKGIVRDEEVQRAVCDKVQSEVQALGWEVRGLIPSPIEGGDGNREFLLGARRRRLDTKGSHP